MRLKHLPGTVAWHRCCLRDRLEVWATVAQAEIPVPPAVCGVRARMARFVGRLRGRRAVSFRLCVRSRLVRSWFFLTSRVRPRAFRRCGHWRMELCLLRRNPRCLGRMLWRESGRRSQLVLGRFVPEGRVVTEM